MDGLPTLSARKVVAVVLLLGAGCLKAAAGESTAALEHFVPASTQAILIYMLVGVVAAGIGVLHYELGKSMERAARAEAEVQRLQSLDMDERPMGKPAGNMPRECVQLESGRLEALGVVASGAAHDLNNMLAPIRLASDYLGSSLDGKRDREMVYLIQSSTERASELVERILAVARGGGHSTMLFRMKHILRELERVVRETFPKNIELSLECPTDLPEIEGHAGQLLQALLNLCVNARDAMPDGGRLSIHATCVCDLVDNKRSEWIQIEIQDSGTGIPSHLQESVFDRFFTTKGGQSGTGQGLTNARSIITEHGGNLRLETSTSTGACFVLSLPAAVIEKTQVPRQRAA